MYLWNFPQISGAGYGSAAAAIYTKSEARDRYDPKPIRSWLFHLKPPTKRIVCSKFNFTTGWRGGIAVLTVGKRGVAPGRFNPLRTHPTGQ